VPSCCPVDGEVVPTYPRRLEPRLTTEPPDPEPTLAALQEVPPTRPNRAEWAPVNRRRVPVWGHGPKQRQVLPLLLRCESALLDRWRCG
jgi:hypothetical protein